MTMITVSLKDVGKINFTGDCEVPVQYQGNYSARPACLWPQCGDPKSYKMVRCYFFFFNGPQLEINYLRMYRNDLHQIFRICTYIGGHDESDLFGDCSLDDAMVTDFWSKSAKIIGIPHAPSFGALTFYNGREDCYIMHTLTPSMPPSTLV